MTIEEYENWWDGMKEAERCIAVSRRVMGVGWDGTAYLADLNAAWEVLTYPSSDFARLRSLASGMGDDFRLCRDRPSGSEYWLEYAAPGGMRKGFVCPTPQEAICKTALWATIEAKQDGVLPLRR
jgi:hypothetical protein